MKILPLLVLTAATATPALAETSRQLDAHEHGVGQLDIAFDGANIAMELHAPGADIVGFEYAATSDEDLAAVNVAIEKLAMPLDLFVLPGAAGCSVVVASAELESEDELDDEEHGHDDHDDEKHEGQEHDHDDHDEHAGETGHTEFHAEYMLICDDTSAVTEITFAYFEAFPNALEVEVQVISDSGATAFEVERDAPVLDLSNLF